MVSANSSFSDEQHSSSASGPSCQLIQHLHTRQSAFLPDSQTANYSGHHCMTPWTSTVLPQAYQSPTFTSARCQ
jgi:hypothetical protein